MEGESSGAEEFRPGERLQRNWASMWLMSQERGLWPERSGEIREEKKRATEIITPAIACACSIYDPVRSGSVLAKAAAQNNRITEAEDDAADFVTADLENRNRKMEEPKIPNLRI